MIFLLHHADLPSTQGHNLFYFIIYLLKYLSHLSVKSHISVITIKISTFAHASIIFSCHNPPVGAQGGGGSSYGPNLRKPFSQRNLDKNCTIDRVRPILIICETKVEKSVPFQNGGHLGYLFSFSMITQCHEN